VSLLGLNDLFAMTRPAPAAHAGTKHIVLTGLLGRPEARELVGHCRRLAEQGWAGVVVDLEAVSSCAPAGLAGLRELHEGRSGLTARIVGGRWSQFLPVLQAAPHRQLPELRRAIRDLLGAQSVFGTTPGHPAWGG